MIAGNQLGLLLKEVWLTKRTPLLKTWLKEQAIEHGNTFLCYELASIFSDEFDQIYKERESFEERSQALTFYRLALFLAVMDSACIDDSSVGDVPVVLSMLYFPLQDMPIFLKYPKAKEEKD